MVEARNT